MNIFKDIWTDLVDKKLWPVALGLIVLLVAVPMTLGKPSEEAATPVETPTGVTAEEGPQLALTRAATTGFARPPRVNDEQLNPFGERGRSAKLQSTADDLSDAVDDILGTDDPGTSITDPGKTPADPEPSTPEPDTEPPVKTEADDLLSILVTAPGVEEPLQINDIRTLSPLVDPESPFLVYVGKTSGNEATFLVSADVSVNGDGSCSPTPADCRTLTLGIGQTAEFTYVADSAKKVTVTVLDIETKHVPIDDGETTAEDPSAEGDESAVAARLTAAKREAGAKALKSVLGDDDVIAELARRKVKIRH